jgi:hypothetical protein
MGSLPPYVDRGLPASWQERIQPPQDQLLSALFDVLPHSVSCLIDAMVKQRIACFSACFHDENEVTDGRALPRHTLACTMLHSDSLNSVFHETWRSFVYPPEKNDIFDNNPDSNEATYLRGQF